MTRRLAWRSAPQSHALWIALRRSDTHIPRILTFADISGAVRYIIPGSAYQDVNDLRAENRREQIRRWHGTAVNVCGQPGGQHRSECIDNSVRTAVAGSGPQRSVRGERCPSGWFCFYKDINLKGRKLQCSDCSSDGVTQYLTTYGFGNQSSSRVVNDSIVG